MEQIYRRVVTDMVNVKEWYTKYKNNLFFGENNCFPSNDTELKKAINFSESDEKFSELLRSLSCKNNLKELGVRIENFHRNKVCLNREVILEIPPSKTGLKTLELLVNCDLKKKRKIFGKSLYSYQFPNIATNRDEPNLKPYEDIVLSIRVYHPFGCIAGWRSKGPKFAEEFLVLGSQRLTEFRDKISCKNTGPFYDVSEHLDKVISLRDTDPGFFFVTDTFYNDTRDPHNPDYSKVILNWTKTREDNFSIPFKTALMQETTFSDLTFRLGYPQVYQHQGNCEHLFTFSSMHLLSPQDDLVASHYPIRNSLNGESSINCDICGDKEYSHIVLDSPLHLHQCAYLCRTCLESFHYVDKKKVGNFRAYKVNQNEFLDVMQLPEGSE